MIARLLFVTHVRPIIVVIVDIEAAANELAFAYNATFVLLARVVSLHPFITIQ